MGEETVDTACEICDLPLGKYYVGTTHVDCFLNTDQMKKVDAARELRAKLARNKIEILRAKHGSHKVGG